MQIETPTSQDWYGFNEFLQRELLPREFVLVTFDGAAILHEVMCGSEAADRNARIAESGQRMRWLPTFDMTPQKKVQPDRTRLKACGLTCIILGLLGVLWVITR